MDEAGDRRARRRYSARETAERGAGVLFAVEGYELVVAVGVRLGFASVGTLSLSGYCMVVGLF